MKTVYRENERGLFECIDVFEQNEYNQIKKMMEEIKAKGDFLEKPHEEDDGIEEHPEWVEHFDVSIQNMIHNFVSSTDIPNLYGFGKDFSLDKLSSSFVLRYRHSDKSNRLKPTLSLHKDISQIEGIHTLSVVFTIKTDECIGGALGYANTNDGNVNHTRDIAKFVPRDNSIYCINGDFVAHCAYGVDSGERFSIVLFYDTPQTKVDVVSLWNPQFRKEFVCPVCYHGYFSRKQLTAHKRGHVVCSDCCVCFSSKAKLRTHKRKCLEELRKLRKKKMLHHRKSLH